MKKTLLITNFFSPAIGGIENYYDNFCRLSGPDKIVVLTPEHGQAPDFDASQKYKIIRTNFFDGRISPRWRPLQKKINKIIKEQGIEQIIFGHFHPYCLLGRKFNLPVYIFGHGTDVRKIKESWWQIRALKKIYRHRNFKKFIANSRFIADEIEEIVGDKTKIEVVYPGIDYDALNRPVEDLAGKKKLLGLDDNDIVLLSVGRVEPSKNYETIIRLMPEMINQISQLKYVIAGDGSDLDRLKSLVQNYGLRYKVIFTGTVANNSSAKAFYYQLAHLFATVSSQPEGFGISYLEAQATKNAVIASKFGGSAEAVKDGETGILVDPSQPEEIKMAILKLASDKELWERMSSAGQLRAQEFDWSKQMDKLNKIFEQ